MKFIVSFRAKSNFAICTKITKEGILLVDEITKKLGKSIDISEIHNVVESVNRNPQVELSENYARKSGRFLYENEITVTVPDNFFNDYLIRDVVKKGDGLAHIELIIDCFRILEFWESSNFKLNFCE